MPIILQTMSKRAADQPLLEKKLGLDPKMKGLSIFFFYLFDILHYCRHCLSFNESKTWRVRVGYG